MNNNFVSFGPKNSPNNSKTYNSPGMMMLPAKLAVVKETPARKVN